ncbi:Mobile element protein [Leuconostoc mesenteroides subsp. cremoris T26]|nr:Mobile element protein [Leuconostoc mesenteroides subsp. cremoris T26]
MENWHPSQQETRRNALKTAIKAGKSYKKPTTTTDTPQKPNLMKNLDDLSGVLTTDITYIQLMNRDWVYLATVYDPEKRRLSHMD